VGGHLKVRRALLFFGKACHGMKYSWPLRIRGNVPMMSARNASIRTHPWCTDRGAFFDVIGKTTVRD
jgi:hypothetical protein